MPNNEMESQIIQTLNESKEQLISIKSTLEKLRNAGMNVSKQLVRLQTQENKINRILDQLGG